MRVLCLVPDANTPGRKDVTGAFYPEALALCRNLEHYARGDALERVLPSTLSTSIVRFPSKAVPAARRHTCTRAIEQAAPLGVLAVFCHGWRYGLQAGWQTANVRSLAALVADTMVENAHVLLYACDTGRDDDDDAGDDTATGPGGDGGFADELRDACEGLGRRVTVMGHTTAGHTTRNPFARRFAPGCQGKGGVWYVEPGSRLWPRWVRALRDPSSTLRLRFWRMTPEQLEAELAGPPLIG